MTNGEIAVETFARAGGNITFRPGTGDPPGDVVFEVVGQVGEWKTSSDGVCGYRIGTTHRPGWIVRLLVWVVLGWKWVTKA